MESMDGMKEKLGKQIDEADCLTDLQPILNTIPLIKIKTFLKQETTMNADRNILMIGCLLSSDKIYAYCIKSKANQSIEDFQQWLEDKDQNDPRSLAVFYCTNWNSKDMIIKKCLGCLGFTVSGYHVTITGYDEPDAIMKARDGQTIYESNYNEIHMDDLGYVDCATFDDAIDVGTFTMDMCDGGFSSYKLYSAFIVDADDANSK
eukprot:759728_1